MAQHAGGLLTRRSDAEIGARHQNITLADARRKIGSDGFQAMLTNHLQAVFHVGPGGQRIGVHIGTYTPHPGIFKSRGVHANSSRASLMYPRKAEAATV